MVMLLVAALASFVVLATRVAADPSNHGDSHPHSLCITKHVGTKGKYNHVQRDRARISHLVNKANPVNSSNVAEEVPELPLNNTGSYYTAKVGVGVPPTYYNLLVDTGSSNTWIGANAPYVKTKTSVNTSELMGTTYGTASFIGHMYNDTVTISPGVTVPDQPIGVAYNSSGIHPLDGILGLGPTDLTYDTISYPHNESTIPTITDRLFAQGTIKQPLIAVSFEPKTQGSTTVNGELTFGATDPTKYIGNISYFPITMDPIAGRYWGIDATSIRYGGANGVDLTTNTTAGLIDTGTSLIYLSTNLYKNYVKSTGGILDNSTGLLVIPSAQYESLRSLYFVIGGETFELTPNAQIWERAATKNGEEFIFLAVQDTGKTTLGTGFDFICGMPFLERFYSVYDSGNRRIGLARTQFTNATTN